MRIEVSMDMPGGIPSRIRFSDDFAKGATLQCGGDRKCTHLLDTQQCCELMSRLGISPGEGPLVAVRAIVNQQLASNMFDGLRFHYHHQELFQGPSEDEAEEDESFTEGCIPPPPKPRRLSKAATRELLELYAMGWDISLIASHLHLSPPRVVRHLAALIFDDVEVASDVSAPRHQKTWTLEEILTLRQLIKLGRTPSEMAPPLGRDPLGVAFKILENFSPAIPREVVKKFGVTTSVVPIVDEGLDSTSP